MIRSDALRARYVEVLGNQLQLALGPIDVMFCLKYVRGMEGSCKEHVMRRMYLQEMYSAVREEVRRKVKEMRSGVS